jgi:hypothetical protein
MKDELRNDEESALYARGESEGLPILALAAMLNEGEKKVLRAPDSR